MATAVTTIRLSDDVKRRSLPMLESLGISLSTYVNMALVQLCRQGKIPFESYVARDVPTEETHRAIVAAQARELGLLPDDAPRFGSADELIDDLMGD